MELNVP